MNWLLSLIVLHLTAVQADSLCSQATATINSQADATALASCSILSGSVLVSSSAAGTISLDGPQQITGDLDVTNAGELTSLSSATIGIIGGTFTLQNVTLLSTLQFSDLTNVGNIAWSSLPALADISFPSGAIQTKSISISNTFLGVLGDFATGVTETLDINNNPRLASANLTVTSITTRLNLAANGKSAEFSFPNLVSAANITATNCSQLSLPSLGVVNGSMGLVGNTFSSFLAPNLTSVGSVATGNGNLIISSNTAMTEMSMPLLTSVGGSLQVAGNGVLKAFGLPALATVGGEIRLIGNFSTPSLDALSNVKGAFDLESSDTSLDCSGFQADATHGIIQGNFKCQTSDSTGTTTSPTTSPTSTNSVSSRTHTSVGTTPTTSSTSTNEPASSAGLPTGAKIGIGVAIPLVAIIVAVIVFAWKKGYKLSLQRTAKSQEADPLHPTQAELPLGGHHEKTELPARVETLQRPHELSANLLGPVPVPVPDAHELHSNERYEAEG